MLFVVPFALVAGSLAAVRAVICRRPTRRPAAGPGARSAMGDRSRWLTLPAPPRPLSEGDDWVLEVFDPAEIVELVALDAAVRSEFAREHHALVLARVPESRRERRVRALVWTSDRVPARTPLGTLSLTLADGTSLEFDGVSHATAVWLGCCHDEFGLVLGAIQPSDTSWAARLHSCGWDTPVRASRVRVSRAPGRATATGG